MSEQMMDPTILQQAAGEAQPRAEAKEAFVAAADRIITAAKGEVQRRFEQSPDADSNLEYHRSNHTEADIRRTDTILEATGADERTRKLGEIASAYHDIVQNWDEIDGMRKRHRVRNEKESADEAGKAMRQQNEEAGEEIFTEEDITIVREAILATVPAFEGGAVIQPNLTPESHPVAVAMALSDLGEAGMDGPEFFAQSSDANFREDNMDVGRAIREARETGEPISDEDKEAYRQRMLNWSRGAIGFVGSRDELFETDIAAFNEGQKEAVRGVFKHFDETANYVEKRYEERRTMTFEELAADVGYEISR